MTDLRELEAHIEARLAAAEQRRLHAEEQGRRRRDAREQRTTDFRVVADRLTRGLIRPALRRLANHFAKAAPLSADETGRNGFGYVFGPTPSFPAVARLEMTVHPDEAVQEVLLVHRLDILFAPSPVQCQDRLVFPLDAVDETAAGAWVGEKLLQFVDVYLRLSNGEVETPANPLIMRTAA
jgi:hypothetical protein